MMSQSAQTVCADLDRLAWCDQPGDRTPAWVRRILASVPMRSQVLDIGCGTGSLARQLATRRGARVTAIDACPTTIDVARLRTRSALGIEYRVGNICELTPEGFRVVICAGGLAKLPLDVALPRMAAGVEPGGLVVLSGAFEGGGLLATVFGTQKVRSRLAPWLPGVRLHRHLGGRYTAIWRRG